MAEEKVYYRFVNLSDVRANVYWMPYPASRQYYHTLKPREFVDINTFLGHCWLFEDAKTGDALVANNCCIFTPTKWREHVLKNIMNQQCSRISRKLLVIRRPQLTLAGLAFSAIRDTNITVKQAEDLMIPKSLKEDLIHMLRKRDCVNLHSARCKDCPYDMHKAHFHHSCNMSACLGLLKGSGYTALGRWVRLPFGRVTCIPPPPGPPGLPRNRTPPDGIAVVRAGNE